MQGPVEMALQQVAREMREKEPMKRREMRRREERTQSRWMATLTLRRSQSQRIPQRWIAGD